MPTQFLTQRNDLTQSTIIDCEPLSAKPGEVVLQVDRFALTANNITYGVAGDMIGYWQFFPAEGDWGRIPVWGMATVSASEHPSVNVGDRYYGYFPMSSELLVKPEKINARGFVDAVEHRSQLPAVYNQYTLVSIETGFAPNLDNHAMLYRPLFTTSFVLDDFFADNDFFGASQIILGSASSKTAFGLAFMLRKRAGLQVIGLTSSANVAFVNNLGLYDEVRTYDDVEAIKSAPSAYIDMAGNRGVLSRVHHHLNEQLRNSCGVGITHWEDRDGEAPESLPGAKPSMFFAPSQIMKRHEELGGAVYQQQIAEATSEFLEQVDAWVKIEEHPLAEVQSVYETVLNGAKPDSGLIVVG
ncbi:MAG: DUF2855 family protein [Pseudomonadales bacterium]|nr:DUF2855 family protein [Pseudomonadales bacterium]